MGPQAPWLGTDSPRLGWWSLLIVFVQHLVYLSIFINSRQGLAGCLLLALPPQPRRDSQLAKIRLAFPGKPSTCPERWASPRKQRGREDSCLLPACGGTHAARQQELPHVLRDVGDRLVTWKREGGKKCFLFRSCPKRVKDFSTFAWTCKDRAKLGDGLKREGDEKVVGLHKILNSPSSPKRKG
uniref:Uncharacterized protein n=1 Tax=Accipiter nisus TaxID=211598 RepID=A0A8B9MZB8_9AVES